MAKDDHLGKAIVVPAHLHPEVPVWIPLQTTTPQSLARIKISLKGHNSVRFRARNRIDSLV